MLDALKKVSSSTRYSSGCGYPQCQNYAPDEVRATIANVDVVFVCLGTGPSIENESRDRSDILLPGYQLQLLQDIVGWSELFTRVYYYHCTVYTQLAYAHFVWLSMSTVCENVREILVIFSVKFLFCFD